MVPAPSGIVINGNEMTGSTQELADRTGYEYATMGILLKFLVSKGVAKSAGTRAPNHTPGKRGGVRATNLYTIPIGDFTISLVVATDMKKK